MNYYKLYYYIKDKDNNDQIRRKEYYKSSAQKMTPQELVRSLRDFLKNHSHLELTEYINWRTISKEDFASGIKQD